MTYIVNPINKPSDLQGQLNGKVSTKLLKPVNEGGHLHHKAALSWKCLQLAAFFEDISLDDVGTYRSLAAQTTLFKARYTTTNNGKVPKVFNGVRYYLKDGFAPAATPGKSNHGLGIAIDVKDASGERLQWLLNGNAEKFGFCWEFKSGEEPWHLVYFRGDVVSRGVRNALIVFPELAI